MASDNPKVMSAAFGAYHLRQLRGWAFCDAKSKATLIRDIVVARTEANQPLIADKTEFFVKKYKLSSADELLDRIEQADREGISVARLHQQLAAEAGVEVETEDTE
jgi:hypothetical protein